MTPKKVFFFLTVVAVLVGGYFLIFPLVSNLLRFGSWNSTAQSGVQSSRSSEEQIKFVNELTNSPVSKATRQVLDLLAATSSKGREVLLSNPPFNKNVISSLTDKKLTSKFIVVNGTEIASVGLQMYFLFPAEPDAVFRAAYQLTNSTTTPVVLVDFRKTEDTQEVINNFLKELGPYLADPQVGQ